MLFKFNSDKDFTEIARYLTNKMYEGSGMESPYQQNSFYEDYSRTWYNLSNEEDLELVVNDFAFKYAYRCTYNSNSRLEFVKKILSEMEVA